MSPEQKSSVNFVNFVGWVEWRVSRLEVRGGGELFKKFQIQFSRLRFPMALWITNSWPVIYFFMKTITVRASVNECSEYAKSSIIGAVLYFTSYVSQTIMSHATQHNVPAHKSNISQKIIVGESLTFSFTMIIRRLLLFARLSYYFSPVLHQTSVK